MTQNTRLVAWQDKYALDMDEIDEQHKMLFDIMNRLWAAIVKHVESEEIGRVIADLERYTVLHFTEEETFMRSIGYVHFDAHAGHHRKFIEQLGKEKQRAYAGQEISLELLHFLRDWLVNHILVEDRRYALWFQAEKRNKSALGRFFARLR